MSLSGWDDTKKLKLTIDNSKVDENLTDFPVLITLSSGCGIDDYDASCVFDEVSTHPYEVCDDFTGVNGSAPDYNLWRTGGSPHIDIYNNKLRFADVSNWCAVDSEFSLSGDFNIQINFEIINGPSTNSWGAALMVFFNDNLDLLQIKRSYTVGQHCYEATECVNGVWNVLSSRYNSTDTSGSLCIIRSGNIFSVYFWHSSGYWYKLASKTYDIAQKDIRFVRLEHGGWDGNPSFSFYFDNFKVNNGISYYPSRLAITATISGVETQCYTEIERWEQENNKAILWTKVPTIVSGSDTELSLYYDKSNLNNWDYIDFVRSAAGKAVWDSNFVGVWHMNQDPTGGSNCISDSTASGSHGTPGGSMTSGDLVDGKVGKALDFDGSDDNVRVSDTPVLDIINTVTLETTIKPTTAQFGAAKAVVTKDDAYLFCYDHPTSTFKGVFSIKDSTTVWQNGGGPLTISENIFHSFAGVYDGTHLRSYLNGVEEANNNIGSKLINNSANDFVISSLPFSQFFDGIIDETRISNIARSAPWIKATYHSNWDNLITYEQYERCFSGVVNVESVPAIRRVNLYDQDTGELINYTISASGTGEWSIDVYGDTVNKYYAVCVPESDNRNAEVFANVTGI